MSAKEIREYFNSDEFLEAKEIAGNSIKRMNIMFDKAEKYDQLLPTLQELVFKFREDNSLGSYEIQLYGMIESVITDGVRCLFLDPDTIEVAGEKECKKTGSDPNPSKEQCEGCSFALYNTDVAESLNNQEVGSQ